MTVARFYSSNTFGKWRSAVLLQFVRRYQMGRDVFGNAGVSVSDGRGKDVEKELTIREVFLQQGVESKSFKDLVNAYRRFGYLTAENLDPLRLNVPKTVVELDPKFYGFDEEEQAKPLRKGSQATLSEMIEHLKGTYSGDLATEFMHIRDLAERQFFANTYEKLSQYEFKPEELVGALNVMLKTKAWENFIALKFPTLKRTNITQGAESMAAFYRQLLEECPQHNISQYIFDGAHRGRLALQTALFNFPPGQLFRKMRGKTELAEGMKGCGDVLTHQHSHFDYEDTQGGVVHVSTLPNPSHLEASLAVSLGKARARAQTLRIGDYGRGKVGDQILPIHHHGDGAFTGQGVVWEALSLSQVPNFRVGGSIHLVVNNQIAFTAEKTIGRSSLHCTDVARAIDSPVIHVNAESVEKVLLAAKIALEYRQEFRKDVFVNLICYRRYGHNELDDPKFTQPNIWQLMYRAVDAKKCLVERFAEELIKNGIATKESVDSTQSEHTEVLRKELELVDSEQTPPSVDQLGGYWNGLRQAPAAVTKWNTGCDTDLLKFVGAASVAVPENFSTHPHLDKTHVAARLKRIQSGEIDWSTAEALAFGTSLLQGFDVRLSGQDVGRATFSHRHAMLVDQQTDSVHVPLNHLVDGQSGFLEIANSPLSEAAIVGFEYGFAIENPRRLVIWEAQFGDFYNGAQVQIDTLIASGESKWLLQNGLVLLLPHGFDGAGPDHSSAHIERFLQLTDSRENQSPPDGDDVNMRVANPTTSAQYFHLLRRQVVSDFRKPLIIIAPKLLLRHPFTVCPIAQFGNGTHFQPVLPDPKIEGHRGVEKIIFCSGKHAVMLIAEREKRSLNNVAIVRIEEICPFPFEDLAKSFRAYPNAKEFIWSQEEPRNAGCWQFMEPRFRNAFGIDLQYVGRPELAWMATPIADLHKKEIDEVFATTFK